MCVCTCVCAGCVLPKIDFLELCVYWKEYTYNMKRAVKQQGIKMSWWDQDDQKEAREFLKDLSGDKRPICWNGHQVRFVM